MIKIHCIKCGEAMNGVTSAETRDTCYKCGGFSKTSEGTIPRTGASLAGFCRRFPPLKTGRR